MKNIQNFLEESRGLVLGFNNFIKSNNLENLIVADHMCYKCKSSESYEEWRRLFDFNSKNIFQSIISDRRIALVTFKNPIQTIIGEIKYLELCDYKKGQVGGDFFDHIEIVPIHMQVEELVELLKNKGVLLEKVERPHHTTFDILLGSHNVKLSNELLINKIKRDEFI